jgi:glycosyltransferase involved in cell wall biosynthesis
MKKNIIIHYPFIAKYRIPIFQKLSEDEKYNITFWASKQGTDEFLLTETKGLNVLDTPIQLISLPFLHNKLEWQPSAIKNILQNSMDIYIVLGNPNSISIWLCLFIAKIRKIPIFMWSHGYLKDERGIKGFIRKSFYKLADKHLLYGNKAKQIMMLKGFEEKKLAVIYNSLDYDKQKLFREKLNYSNRLQTRKELNINENSITLIAIGRIMDKLKLDQAIKALYAQTKNGKDISLIIVGDGPQKVDLIKLTNELGLVEKVCFYGACHDEEQLSKLYNCADYSVVMGKVGLSAMHSLAYGIPMITNNNMDCHFPEVEAILDGKTGFFFKENSIDDFVTKLLPIPYRGKIYKECINIIERLYTPEKQKEFISNVINESSKIKDL